MANYELWYCTDLGERLEIISDVQSFEYVKVFGDVGVGIFNIPRRGQIYDNLIPDRRIHIYRQPTKGTLGLELVCFARKFSVTTNIQGQTTLKITAPDQNNLLSRRITAYYANETETKVSGNADDLMKEIVRDNFIDNADYSGTPDPARDIDDYGFSVQANNSAGSSISKAISWRNVLAVLQDFQAASKSAGTEAFFGVMPTSDTTLQFQTWTGQPGRDRTIATGINPIVFSLEWGNLSDPQLSDDYVNEANYIYAGGRGREDVRNIQTASDTSRMNVSRFGRHEAFTQATAEATTAYIQDVAKDILARRRPKKIFRGAIHNTPLTPYGGLNGWHLGDKISINYSDLQFDVIIRSVSVRVEENNREIITARVETL